MATTRVGHTHVYMHCIAKTLLTELHLAILVPLLCLCVTSSAPFPLPLRRSLLFSILRFCRHLRLSFTLSLAPARYGARVCLRIYTRGATPSGFRKISHTTVVSLMARLMVWGKSAGRWMGGARDREDEKRDEGQGERGATWATRLDSKSQRERHP